MLVKIGKCWFDPENVACISPEIFGDTYNDCTGIYLIGNPRLILVDDTPENAATIVQNALVQAALEKLRKGA